MKSKPKRSLCFRRITVSLPKEISQFAEMRAAEPEYAGSFSGYVRNLIVGDKRSLEAVKGANGQG